MKVRNLILRRFNAFCVVLFILVFSIQGIKGQNPITFVITNVPSYTPTNDTLYLVSSLDNWQLANPNKAFKLYSDGCYRLTVDIGDVKKFEFKINRGDWDKVEGNKWGDYLSNHRVTYNDTIFEIRINIESWQDIHHTEFPPIQVTVVSVPENTPHDATIYISGTFNDWMDNDPAYAMTRKPDGSYVGEIQSGLDTINYKFGRGSWKSIEGRWDGGMRSNRTYISNNPSNHQIIAEIKSWQDLSSGLVGLKVIFIVLLLQCVVVISMLIRFERNPFLSILMTLIALAFLTKFVYADYSFLQKYPQGYFVPAIIYAVLGTWIYTWFKSKIKKESFKISYVHFIPLLPLVWYLVYLKIPSKQFYLNIVNNEFKYFFFATYTFALGLSLIFNYKLKHLISKQIADVPDLTYRFYKTVQLNWSISSFLFIAGIISLSQNAEIKFIIDWLENLLWLGIGIVVISYEWLFFTNLYTVYLKNKSKISKDFIEEDSWARLKLKLTELMVDKHIYTDANLTLADLAGYLGTNNHYVSKLINEGFKKSYTDYVNSYRIEAFIKEVKTDKSNNTFLSIAYKVGFNSKSAFNRAFKKATDLTPSEYFSEENNQA